MDQSARTATLDKFRAGEIVYSGDKASAMVYVLCGNEAMARTQILAEKKSQGYYSTAASSGRSFSV